MAEHEPCIGATDDWYTPPNIFDALGLIFDLDPCSPGPAHWVPARKIYTKEDDGLVQPWSGTVFMNPPFGRRNGHVPWLRKFLAHGDGIAIVRAYTHAMKKDPQTLIVFNCQMGRARSTVGTVVVWLVMAQLFGATSLAPQSRTAFSTSL